ncbi:hypothetical protein AAVH_39823 [Aphelenchoides avenae]|nr:hypothetical protein AAVH_39823 [Aphelenchus avenae]
MEAQNDSRTVGGSLDAYEDRTHEIMQHNTDLSENCDRLQYLARDLQPHPEDHYQRLCQLYTYLRNGSMGRSSHQAPLRRRATQNAAASIAHSSFDSAFLPKQLDDKQMDLLEHLHRTQQHIEDIVQDREDAASATRSRSQPADNAGGSRALSAAEQQRTTIHRRAQPPTPIEKQPSKHRTGWHTARGRAQHRPQRSEADNATAAAPTRVLEADNAARTARGRGPSQDRPKAMMSSFATSAGTGRTTNSSSGPLQVGADGKPLSRSSADAKPPASARGAADHGPEPTNAFTAHAEVITAQCALCSGSHWPSQCPRYNTATKRLRRDTELHYCFLCLKGSHRSYTCPQKTGEPCQRCGRREHHRALRPEKPTPPEELQSAPMSATKTEQATPTVPPGVPSTAPPSPTRFVHQEYSVPWFKHHPQDAVSNSMRREIQPSRDPRTDPDRPPGTRGPTTVISKTIDAKDAHASDAAEYLT